MRFDYPEFGRLVVDGTSFDHDIVVEDGVVRRRDKGPSRGVTGRSGHTPLSSLEDIPWSASLLLIGSGHSGRLPILAEVEAEAGRRGVELKVMPTADAVALLNESDQADLNAILHVTC